MNNSYRLFLLGIIWFLFCQEGSGQGWQRFWGGAGNERAFSVRLSTNGTLEVLGSRSDSASVDTDWLFLEVDTLGDIQEEGYWGRVDTSESPIAFFPFGTGRLVIGTESWPENIPPTIDTRSAIVWGIHEAPDGFVPLGRSTDVISLAYSATAAPNGYLIAGANAQPIFDSYFPQPYLVNLDENGNLKWAKTYPLLDEIGNAAAIVAIDSDASILVNYAYFNTNGLTTQLLKLDSLGQVLTEKRLPLPGIVPGAALRMNNGQVLLTGNTASPQSDLFVAAIDPQTLDTLWTKVLPIDGRVTPHDLMQLPNGHFVISGEVLPEGGQNRDGFAARIDDSGHLIWYKTYGGIQGDILWDVTSDTSGTCLYLVGQTASFSLNGNLQAWLIKTDSNGIAWSNVIEGKVFWDTFENCSLDGGEPVLPHWIVVAQSPDGLLYTTTDSSGTYRLEVGPGDWKVSVSPASGYWSAGFDTLSFTFGPLPDSMVLDFPFQAVYECPLLDVDISTPFLRRCADNTFFIRYYNFGTAEETDARVEVVLEPYFVNPQSTQPFVQIGDTLIFELGSVPTLSGGSFNFSAYLDCDSTFLGQVHCAEAYILPDSSCFEFSPQWDGSSLEVSGFCAGDSVVLIVKNVGLAMQDAVEYIITEDQIIFRKAMLQLNSGQDTTFVIYPNGATVTILVHQTPEHPGDSQPMLVIEGCGDGLFSTGYAFQFPQNDGNPGVDIECRANIGSFDPNDKTGIPLGVGAEHVVSPGVPIEYLIRFQNTGTDTAFSVRITDELSPVLDISSLKIGAASHPFKWRLEGAGRLVFDFNPIELPDSIANFFGSMGFVKFTIQALKTAPPGSQIWNRAGIYFDQNEAVITNQTLHTIEIPENFLLTNVEEPSKINTLIPTFLSAHPNPAGEILNVRLTQPFTSKGLQLAVLDVLGRKVLSKTWPAEADTSTMSVGQLPPGFYFLAAYGAQGQVIDVIRFTKH
ncbi:MAG: T9SS type A sorting domain-containing protein [Saprospiraceae bacterium]|nr:T9SS type A sorting domain-containing protein [Saprospiraceae bacterium]